MRQPGKWGPIAWDLDILLKISKRIAVDTQKEEPPQKSSKGGLIIRLRRQSLGIMKGYYFPSLDGGLRLSKAT